MMSGLEEILEDLNCLLSNANSYANAFEEASIVGKMLSSTPFELPFSESMMELERELVRVKKDIFRTLEMPSRENCEALYSRVAPLFREQETARYEGFIEFLLKGSLRFERNVSSDPITSYAKSSMETLLAFSDGDTVFSENLAQEKVLMSFMFDYVDGASLFLKESMEKASQEVIGNIQVFLRKVQHLYRFDVESAIRSYASLLGKIQNFCEENGVPGMYGEATPRHIQSLKLSSQSSFQKSKAARSSFVQMRKEIISDPDAVKLLATLSQSLDWGINVLDVAEYVRWRNAEDIDRYHILDYGKGLAHVPFSKVDISDVIGQEDNVKRLGQCLYAFASGGKVPPIILRGGPGVGKTLSIRALAEIHPDLRIVMVKSVLLSDLDGVFRRFKDSPYRIALYADDMHFGMNFDFEGFKTTTSGIRNDWPGNILLVASVNPESYDRAIPSSVKSRWIEIDYGDHLPETYAEDVFRSICKNKGLPYAEQLYADFRAKYMQQGLLQRVGLKETPYNGRLMEQFIMERSAIEGIPLPEYLK